MSETSGMEAGEGLADPELVRELLVQPDSGREVGEAEAGEFITELQILMDAVDRLAERGKVYLEISVDFAGGPEPRTADNRLSFNYSIQD